MQDSTEITALYPSWTVMQMAQLFSFAVTSKQLEG